jgi:hypothetical protein
MTEGTLPLSAIVESAGSSTASAGPANSRSMIGMKMRYNMIGGRFFPDEIAGSHTLGRSGAPEK